MRGASPPPLPLFTQTEYNAARIVQRCEHVGETPRPWPQLHRERAALLFCPQSYTVDKGTMTAKPSSFFHLHLISDSTGETLVTVARAARAQYTNVSAVEHVYPAVRSNKQLDLVLRAIEEEPGVVLYTLLDEALIGRLEDTCHNLGLPCLSILGPVLQLFQSHLATESTQQIGAQHVLDSEYFRRMDALNYTMMHDDGQLTDDLERADVVLLGVSRTSKTPTSIYLANRGVKTANIPLVPGVPIPPQLEKWNGRWSMGFTPARNGSCRSGRTDCWASMRARTTSSTSITRCSGRRGDILSPVVRKAQLADHRRHAALD